jgi:hypothetical protein
MSYEEARPERAAPAVPEDDAMQRTHAEQQLRQRHASLHRRAYGDDIDGSIRWVAQTVLVIAGVLVAALFLIWALGG